MLFYRRHTYVLIYYKAPVVVCSLSNVTHNFSSCDQILLFGDIFLLCVDTTVLPVRGARGREDCWE